MSYTIPLPIPPAQENEPDTVEGRLAEIFEGAEVRADEYRLSSQDRARVVAALRAATSSTEMPLHANPEKGRSHNLIVRKIWGTTQPLLRSRLFELHRMVIKPMHRCSFHEHQFKHNAFYILEGILFIDTSIGRSETQELRAGDTYTIAPGVKHQFRTGEQPCIALEMYYPESLTEDIVRYDRGAAL